MLSNNMKMHLLLVIWIVWVTRSQTWNSSYDTAFEYQDYTFNFNGDTDREIRKVILSPDETHLYGAARGTNSGSNVVIFKYNTQLSLQWSRKLAHDFEPSFAFELDSSQTNIYMSIDDANCVIMQMSASDGSTGYAKHLLLSDHWRYIALNYNDAYLYGLYSSSKL